MPRSYDSEVLFVSSNRHKYDEAKGVLKARGIRSAYAESELEEIQSDSLAAVAQAKARDAFSKFQRPVMVEDDGIFVDALGGFPGVYSSYVHKTIGLDGVLRLLEDRDDRSASFAAVVSYCEDGAPPRTFEGRVSGAISAAKLGRGWGYDPVFVPDDSDMTFAQMSPGDKTRMSHRSMALGLFADWYLA